MNKRIVSFILTVAMSICLVTGCTSNKADEFVTLDNVNTSSVNVSEGYFQSIFTGDVELFEACYPNSFFYMESGQERFNPESLMAQYAASLPVGYRYDGATMSAYNEYTEDNGYDLPYLMENINVFHMVPEEDIQEAQIVKLRLFFMNDEDKPATIDVYILVYKANNSWYVFELQNADAEFAA